MRSGDTPAQRRRTLISSPPDILITTPESLYLMLTSAARETLDTVRTVVSTRCAVAGTKRGRIWRSHWSAWTNGFLSRHNELAFRRR